MRELFYVFNEDEIGDDHSTDYSAQNWDWASKETPFPVDHLSLLFFFFFCRSYLSISSTTSSSSFVLFLSQFNEWIDSRCLKCPHSNLVSCKDQIVNNLTFWAFGCCVWDGCPLVIGPIPILSVIRIRPCKWVGPTPVLPM